MMGFDVKVTHASAIQQDTRKMAMPLVEAATMAVGMILRRATKGKAANGGSFGDYSSRTWDRPFWVKQGNPQPSFDQIAQLPNGSVGYPGSGAYMRAQGKFKKTFFRTGHLWRSINVHMMNPHKVRIRFKGKSRNGITPQKLMNVLARKTGNSPVDLSRGEMYQIQRFVQKAMPARLLDALKYKQMSFKARAKLRSAESALAKARVADRSARSALGRLK